MAEVPTGRQEQGGRPEILDSEKLKNHGALYGRFLLASLPEAKINDIINPDNKKVEFNNLTADTLEKRNYNPVFENFSLAERKEEWKGIEYSKAYTQWRTKFTGFMVNIQDPKREKALRAILENNKAAKEFTVDDADTLFKEFCQGKSDIANFITRVTTNLVSRGKINPQYLQELLPHLEWIASGLFGKNTASQAVTRLIELESAIYNNPMQVVEIFNSNKERINTPTDGEKKALGLLYNSLSLPQEKVPGPTAQEGEPVIITDAPKAVPQEVVLQAAPVISEEAADEDEKDELLPPPPPPPVETSSASQVLEQEVVSELEAAHKPVITDQKAVAPAGGLRPKESIAGKGIIRMAGVDPADLSKTLNDYLSLDKDRSGFTFGFLPDFLREYIISMVKGSNAKTGRMQVDKDDNRIKIFGLEISRLGIKAKLDLVIRNGQEGIVANVEGYYPGFLARSFLARRMTIEEEVKEQLKTINSYIQTRLKLQIGRDNPSWNAKNISISKGNFLIEFEKTQAQTLTEAEVSAKTAEVLGQPVEVVSQEASITTQTPKEKIISAAEDALEAAANALSEAKQAYLEGLEKDEACSSAEKLRRAAFAVYFKALGESKLKEEVFQIRLGRDLWKRVEASWGVKHAAENAFHGTPLGKELWEKLDTSSAVKHAAEKALEQAETNQVF